MKRYLVGYNECGEMKEIEVEVGCDTLEELVELSLSKSPSLSDKLSM